MKYSAHKILQATDFEGFLAEAKTAKESHDIRLQEIREKRQDRARKFKEINALSLHPHLAVLAALRHCGNCTEHELYEAAVNRRGTRPCDVRSLIGSLRSRGYTIHEGVDVDIDRHGEIAMAPVFFLELNE